MGSLNRLFKLRQMWTIF